MIVLVSVERLTGMKFATSVPTKGPSGKFAVDRAVEFIAEVEDIDGKIISKNDQEPSIQYFMKDLVESRESGRSHLEESPIKSSGSSGVVERGVQGVEGHIRVPFLALQGRIGRKIDARGKVINFFPEYASYLMVRMVR